MKFNQVEKKTIKLILLHIASLNFSKRFTGLEKGGTTKSPKAKDGLLIK